MAVMLTLLLLGVLLPSPNMLPPGKAVKFVSEHPYLASLSKKLNIQKITSSWFFLILPFFLFISITACTVKRVTNFLKINHTFFQKSHTSRSGKQLDSFIFFLKKRFWRVNQKENTIYATKGRIGFAGSIIFHAGMLVCFAGIVLSSMTSFKGSLMCIEGRKTGIEKGNFAVISKEPVFNFLLPPVNLSLNDFKFTYREDGTPLNYSAHILFEDENMNIVEREIAINKPLKYRALQFTLQRFGITPYIEIKEKNGEVIFKADVNLAAVNDAYDMFLDNEHGLTIYTEFYPDMGIESGKPVMKSKNIGNPGLFIILKDKSGNEYSNGVYFGSEVNFGDYTVSIGDLKYWVELELSVDYGIKIIIFGFCMILIGLMVRFIDYDRYIYLKVEDGRVSISGGARIFKDIFSEELEKLKKELEELEIR